MSSPNLVSIREASAKTSLSRTQINALRKVGRFPEAVTLGDKRVAFVATEIDAWISERIAARNARAAQ